MNRVVDEDGLRMYNVRSSNSPVELKIRSYSLSLPCKVGLLWQLAPPNVLKSGPTGKGPVEVPSQPIIPWW
ncbi:hypothetical protein OUZ56_022119 [Daphnia magna]|uniref:Uncharacterized protein n=1 Tax=Daphnia magna TaxID=35525 RepID=A0ABR0AVF2_9CRUS|nr:hypothetical protein OUZ56_022119 [Daphnia magna]